MKKSKIDKYWHNRDDLYPEWDKTGIKTDEEGLFSITPARFAAKIAIILKALVNKYNNTPYNMLEIGTGIGGNLFEFSKVFDLVSTVEYNLDRLELAKSNCKTVLSQEQMDKITFHNVNVKDFFKQNELQRYDLVFMDPPWFNEKVSSTNYFTFENIGYKQFNMYGITLVLYILNYTNLVAIKIPLRANCTSINSNFLKNNNIMKHELTFKGFKILVFQKCV
uniref:Methyltransferase n=1 Tax=viral metagenome TaxID=1070528 RepID=A0A6C0CLX6_9ZZZZ